MSKVVAGVASSHAFALLDPELWEEAREKNRAAYQRRWSRVAEPNPGLTREDPEDIDRRYDRIRQSLDAVRASIASLSPDVAIIFGDDQHEHFTDIVPQLAIYTGDRLTVRLRGMGTGSVDVECPSSLARNLLQWCIDDGFDVTEVKKLPDEVMESHAIAQIVHYFELGMPVLPVWVNGIVTPAPSPGRCHAFGQSVGRGLRALPGDHRVLTYGSGGLSHFTAGYPYDAMEVPEAYGAIHEDFDHKVISAIKRGDSGWLTSLTSKDLLDHGEIETRQWLVMMGLLGDESPKFIEYEAFYSGIMGMGVAYWEGQAA